jgi:hypothetical protein
MKAMNYLIVMLVGMSIVACSNATDDEITENVSEYSILKNTYNIEEISTGNYEEANSVPSITTDKMKGILEALNKNSNIEKSCIVTNTSTEEEDSYKITMSGDYKAISRGGTEDFALRVDLKFSIDNGQLYYWGTEYTYSSNLFTWSSNSMTLLPVKDGIGTYTYEFTSKGYIYFKVADKDNSLVRVPVVFKGKHDFDSNKGTYSFQLAK